MPCHPGQTLALSGDVAAALDNDAFVVTVELGIVVLCDCGGAGGAWLFWDRLDVGGRGVAAYSLLVRRPTPLSIPARSFPHQHTHIHTRTHI